MLDQFEGEGMSIPDSLIPLGRRAVATEVADLVLWLASQESSYCTGSEFVIDGGLSMA